MGSSGGFWSGPQKLVELSAGRHLVEEVVKDGVRLVRDVRAREETKPATPPDCLATNERGELIGMEVTELVEQSVIPNNIKSAKDYRNSRSRAETAEDRMRALIEHSGKCREWSLDELVARLREIIERKAGKPFQPEHGYAEKWLVIYTDELGLPSGEYDEGLRKREFTTSGQFDAVYLLWSYCPFRQGHPWLQLRLSS